MAPKDKSGLLNSLVDGHYLLHYMLGIFAGALLSLLASLR